MTASSLEYMCAMPAAVTATSRSLMSAMLPLNSASLEKLDFPMYPRRMLGGMGSVVAYTFSAIFLPFL